MLMPVGVCYVDVAVGGVRVDVVVVGVVFVDVVVGGIGGVGSATLGGGYCILSTSVTTDFIDSIACLLA